MQEGHMGRPPTGKVAMTATGRTRQHRAKFNTRPARDDDALQARVAELERENAELRAALARPAASRPLGSRELARTQRTESGAGSQAGCRSRLAVASRAARSVPRQVRRCR